MIVLLLTLALIGFGIWIIITTIPMPDVIRKIIVVVGVVLIVLYLVQLFGVDLPVPHR